MDDETTNLLNQLEYYTNLINQHKGTFVNKSKCEKNEDEGMVSCSSSSLPQQKGYLQKKKYKLQKVPTLKCQKVVGNSSDKQAPNHSSSIQNVPLSSKLNPSYSTRMQSDEFPIYNSSNELSIIETKEYLPKSSKAFPDTGSDIFTSQQMSFSSNKQFNPNPYKFVNRNVTTEHHQKETRHKNWTTVKTSNSFSEKGYNKLDVDSSDQNTKYQYTKPKQCIHDSEGQKLTDSVSKINDGKVKAVCSTHANGTEQILKEEEKGPLFDIKKELDKINLIQTNLNVGQNNNAKKYLNKSQSFNKYKLIKHSSLPSGSRSNTLPNQATSEVYSHKYKLVKSKTSLPDQSHSGLMAKGPFKLVQKSHIKKENVNLKLHRNDSKHCPNKTNAENIAFVKANGTNSKTSLSNCILTRHRLIKKKVSLVKKNGNNLNFPIKRSNVSLHKSRYRLVKQAVQTVKTTRHPINVVNRKYSLIKSFMPVTDFDINKALGRKIKNISSNKYKFIKPKTQRHARLKVKHMGPSKFKLDKRRLSRDSKPMKRHSSVIGHLHRKSGTKFVQSGNMMINTGSWNITLRRKSVRRLSEDSMNKTSTQLAARQALARSIEVQHKYKKDHSKNYTPTKSQKFCLYYNRFGRCSRGTSCQFIHDPNQVAVCTRFLRGTCQVNNCPFSHKISKEKMPVCKFFLKGQCHKEDCPYLHVNVGMDADVCEDFVNGYCKAGDQCTKKHVWLCPEFEKHGKCIKGKTCKLQHLQKGRARKRKSITPPLHSSVQPKLTRDPTEVPAVQNNVLSHDTDDINLPMKDRQLPTFISIDTASNQNNYAKQSELTSTFEIKPNLLEETSIKIIEDE